MTLAAALPKDAAAWRGGLERAWRIIGGFDDAAAREFARVTGQAAGLAGSPSHWGGGLLNQSGAPLEFSFSTRNNELRYTLEIGGRDTAPASRLAYINVLLEALGLESGWEGAARQFPALQQEQGLAWGAWLAARQAHPACPGLQPGTCYKVYAEVPRGRLPAAHALMQQYLGAAPLADAPLARLVMVGAAPGAARCEFYFELGSRIFSLACLHGLMDRVGLAHRCDALARLIDRFEFRRGRQHDALPNAQYGFSYAISPERQDATFSVIVFAADLAGGDAWVRHQLLTDASRQGMALPLYAALSEPVAGSYFCSEFHNMLTFSVDAAGPPAWQISISPPPEVLTDPTLKGSA